MGQGASSKVTVGAGWRSGVSVGTGGTWVDVASIAAVGVVVGVAGVPLLQAIKPNIVANAIDRTNIFVFKASSSSIKDDGLLRSRRTTSGSDRHFYSVYKRNPPLALATRGILG
jgi:hypothetical protein